AVNPGTANITATSEGKVSPPLPITVTPAAVASVTVSASPYPNLYPGQPPFPAAVQAYDASGNPLNLSGRTIVWSSADASIASVTAGLPGSATIAPLKVGTTTVTASVDGVQATTPVTVVITAVPVDRVTVSPASAAAQTGAPVQFGATALDSTGATLAGVTFTWSTSNAKATVNSAGLASAVDSGSVNVIATAANQGSGGSSPAGSGTLVISLAPIGSVTLTPTSLTLPSRNAAGTLTVDVRSATNVALQGRTCTVLSANTGVFIVTSAATAITDANGQIAVGIKGAGLGSAALDVTCDPTSPTPAAATATITVP
ncbi:MAG TPA: Ig-like domain-containing protein, partial [Gemmatimonadaceae bacterium]|nr:Ig-like domain-containing protein [Gemmatimonadaceae bacterium]